MEELNIIKGQQPFMEFHSSSNHLPPHIYPHQWSQQQEGGGGGGGGGGGSDLGISHHHHHHHHHHQQQQQLVPWGVSTAVQDHGSDTGRPPGSMVLQARLAKLPPPEAALKCPRCESTNTKFCYFNNYSLSQPRHFCKTCRRYWTRGGALRNVPVGGGCRRNKKITKRKRGSSRSPASLANSPNSTPRPISMGIFENILGQTLPATHLPILPGLPPLSEYSQTDVYGQPAAGIGGMGSSPVGLILEDRSFDQQQQWMREGQAAGNHDHQFPFMVDPGPDPSQLAVATTTSTDPLMKVELGSLKVNLSRNLLESINDDNLGDHDHHHYWAGVNHNVISNNIIASSAWTDHHHHHQHLSGFETSSSTPSTRHLL